MQHSLQVKKAAMEASAEINARRNNRGLKPRPVRAVVIGFPNVGKSALINRLLNRRVCESAPKPGVTQKPEVAAPWRRLRPPRCSRSGLHLCNVSISDLGISAPEDGAMPWPGLLPLCKDIQEGLTCKTSLTAAPLP